MREYHCLRRACALMLAIMMLVGAAPALPAAWAEADGVLRVKLTRLGAPASVTLDADCALRPSTGGGDIPAGTEVTVSANGGRLLLESNGQQVDAGATLRLSRAETGGHGIQFRQPGLSNRFCGDLALTAAGDVISAVLNLYVEDYLYGVVGYEMPPSAGEGALQAQAVAARSYALSQKAMGVGEYDLTDTAGGFTYKGLSDSADYARANQAVDDTRGQVLWYGDALACGYCTESNGGQTESAANAFGSAAAYTAVSDDAYDYESSAAKKTATLSRDGSGLAQPLAELLSEAAARELTREAGEAVGEARITAIESVEPVEPRFAAPSRLYTALRMTVRAEAANAGGNSADVEVSVDVPTYGGLEDWYDLSLNDEDNETVWVEDADDGFTVTFRRSGHGVGMSQKGAQLMANEYHMDCAAILAYYYPGARLEQLALAEKATAQPQPTKRTGRIAIAEARLKDRTDLLKKASEGAASVAVLPAGATVEIYAAQGRWAAVGSGGQVGYLPLSALMPGFLLAGPNLTRLNPPDILVLSEDWDLLELPMDGATALRQLPAGEELSLTARTDDWLEVAAPDGLTGFLPADAMGEEDALAGEALIEAPEIEALGLEAPELEETATPTPAPEATPTPAPTFSLEEADLPEDMTPVEGEQYAQLTESASLYRSVNGTESIAILERNSYVQRLAESDQWAYVQRPDGERGFVQRSVLTAVTLKTPKPDDTAGEGGRFTKLKGKKKRYVYADADDLALYEHYSESSGLVATLSRGQKLLLRAYNDKWAYVSAGDRKGFALRSGLTASKPSVDAAPAGEPLPGEESLAGPSGGPVKKVKGKKIVAIKENLTVLYSSWSTGSQQLAWLEKGDKVRLLAYNTEWAYVNNGKQKGYVQMSAITGQAATSDAGASRGGPGFDAETLVDLKLYPDDSMMGAALATVEKGETVRVLSYDHQAACVEYNNMKGYLAVAYLKRK